jgi:hypothetical protein
LNGTEQNIEVGGKSYRMGKLDLAAFRKFAEWAKTVLPDPYADVVKLKDIFGSLAPDVQRELLDKCQSRAATFGTLQDERILPLAGSVEGATVMFRILYGKCNPSMSQAELDDLAIRTFEEHAHDLEKIINTATGFTEVTESEIEDKFHEDTGALPAATVPKA